MQWSNLIDASLVSYSLFHIDVQIISQKNICWRWTGFRNPKTTQRPHGLTLLRRLSSLSSLPWVCAGDFSEILSVNEKSGEARKPRGQVESFWDTLDDCGLQDLGFTGPSFTWCNKRNGEEMIHERLDRCIVFVQGYLVKHEELQRVSSVIEKGSWMDIRNVEGEMDKLLEQEEAYWRQRSRDLWLKKGDQNSSYFHSKASTRRVRSNISGLHDGLNCWSDNKGDIVHIVEQYFDGLFCSQSPTDHDLQMILDCVDPCLSDSNRAPLDVRFSGRSSESCI
ncbi:hypothetical protein Ddye_016535 [Dipteronia dyeriana]|uniref:Uncharacterized protein n=1 Tax=Dipteronia dyeriana TaxID=168575 RepID=A0AAD9U6Z6_9ROSI|nr:hypothetical protein Ddye_016535 [Dipteronia dyeriana]